jgi:hypothetical protein
MSIPRKNKDKDKIELVPDAWPRFEKFITEIVKAGPQHRSPKAGKSMAPKELPAQSKKRRIIKTR